ncbi:MAG TPA: YcjF family protein [Kiritimatiellia bacterium]|nr:YcjF family protein [Kiritimatiellia bacterium]
MIGRLWKLICRISLVVASFLGLFFLGELARLYMLFYRIHPIAGWTYAAILGLGFLYVLVRAIVAWRSIPRALTPPPRPDLDHPDHKAMLAYSRYLARFLRRMGRNTHLPQEARSFAREKAADIADTLSAHPLNDDLVRTIQKTENEVIAPLLQSLDELAAGEVRKSVRDVMLGVTFSPYPSVDLLVVLYRNTAMVLRVSRIYRARPSPREELTILRDIMTTVAAVNFLNISRKLMESLLSQIPFIGGVADDIAQGIGAGLLTSVTGHAAMDRSGAFRGWNREEEIQSLGSKTAGFLKDVKDMFTKDLLPDLKPRICAVATPAQADAPGFWEKVIRGVAAAVDATARTLDFIVIKPATASVQGVATAGAFVTRSVADAGSSIARGAKHAGRSSRRHISRVLQTFGQRIKYTFLSRHPK